MSGTTKPPTRGSLESFADSSQMHRNVSPSQRWFELRECDIETSPNATTAYELLATTRTFSSVLALRNLRLPVVKGRAVYIVACDMINWIEREGDV